MLFKIYFNNRQICIAGLNDEKNQQLTGENIICKNTKSFDKAYIDFLNNTKIEDLNILCPSPEDLFKHLKKKFKIIKAAGGAVLNPKSELLIIRRLGFWDLPKGKIEKSETKKDAAIREVQEECGIDNLKIISKIGKTYHTYHFKGEDILKVTHWYKMSYTGNELPKPQIEEDITEVKWIVNSEIDLILENTYKNLVDIFKIIRNN
jgi:8-oxo-dGTP pyrophosphatase MutT (NUDIX family)